MLVFDKQVKIILTLNEFSVKQFCPERMFSGLRKHNRIRNSELDLYLANFSKYYVKNYKRFDVDYPAQITAVVVHFFQT